MDKLIDLMTGPFPWIGLLTLCLVFGFAPTTILRVLVKAWPKNDPRRRELMAEIQTIAYWERPLWVFEQIESALFDGLRVRFRHRNPISVLSAYAIVLLELAFFPVVYVAGKYLSSLAAWLFRFGTHYWGSGFPDLLLERTIRRDKRKLLVITGLLLITSICGHCVLEYAEVLEDTQERLVGKRLVALSKKIHD